MTLSAFTVTIVTLDDAPHNTLPLAPLEIRNRLANGTSGTLASIFSDAAGTTPITQTGATTDSLGQFLFYASPAPYNAVFDNNGTPVISAIDVGLTTVAFASAIDRLNPATLAVWQADTSALAGDVVTTAERSANTGGGATGDVIAGAVTANGSDKVANTANTLTWVLRINDDTTSREFGAKFDGGDDILALQAYVDNVKTTNKIGKGDISIGSGLVVNDDNLTGAGMRKTIIRPLANNFDAVTWPNDSDFFAFGAFSVIYPSLGTGNAVSIGNLCHNFFGTNIETTLANKGIKTGAGCFAMAMDQIRSNEGVNCLSIEGAGNATTLQLGTIYANNCSGANFFFNDIHEVVVDNLISDLAGNFPVLATNVTSLIINNFHLENGDFGSSTERAYIRLDSCENVHINNIFAAEMTSVSTHYVIRVVDGPTKLWLKGLKLTNVTNNALSLINEGGTGRPGNSYTFEGTDVDENSIVTTSGTVTGKIAFPDFQDFYFSDQTDANGKISVTHPSVPAILGANPKGIFANVLDGGTNSGQETITFSGVTQVQLRSLSTGSPISTSGVDINVHLRFQR
jgi:hypothetical protein